MAFPIGSMGKNSPAVQETQEVQALSLGREGLMEEEIGYPLQYSCLKNPMDRGAWQDSLRGFQSGTQLKDWALNIVWTLQNLKSIIFWYFTKYSFTNIIKNFRWNNEELISLQDRIQGYKILLEKVIWNTNCMYCFCHFDYTFMKYIISLDNI